MPIEDVFTITGRGTVVTGRIEQGKMTVGEEIEIVGIHPETEKTVITGLEMFQKTLDYAQAGDNAGALLRGIKREDVERGQVLAKPGSITPHTQYKAEVYVLSKDEGGRHTPFFDGYRPQFYFRTTDVTGSIKLPEGQEMVMPGDNTNMEIEPSSRSPWTRASASRSARAGAPSAPASSRRSEAGRGVPAPNPLADETHGAAEDPHPAEGLRPPAGDRSASQIVETAQRTGATITRPVPLPTEKNVYCVIRSPFKDKDSRSTSRCTHKRLIDIHSPTPKTVDSLMRLDLPAGVDIEIKL